MTAATIKIPDFEVDFTSPYSDASVHWEDKTRRYHFWLTKDGERADDTIHSNPREPQPRSSRDTHRALKATAKKWAPIVDAIMEKIATDDLITKARATAEAKQAAECDARKAAQRDALLSRFVKGQQTLPSNIAEHLGGLSADQQVEFVKAVMSN